MKNFIVGLIALSFLVPAHVFAQDDFEISGWIPYWRAEKGVDSTRANLDTFSEVNPFIYTVKVSGELNQADSVTDDEWLRLQRDAKAKGIKYIPTVMWAGGDAIHDVLSDDTKRAAHIRSIAQQVYQYGFDGIDIDYEAKYARTREYFSLFLKELNDAIGYDKWVMCTIESRTPLDSVYSSPDRIPDDIEYSNDFKEINKYCDRVRMMAYDQGRWDLKLRDANEHPYTPVADVVWVEKVMRLAMEDIDRDKLVVGVPTYGYEYDMFVNSRGNTEYSRLWSFNPGYATEIAERLNLDIKRSGANEAQITFPASLSEETIPLPNATRVATWADAESIKDKVELAQELGLRGVAIFKIDGGEDQGIWDVLDPYVGTSVSTSVKAPDARLIAESANTSASPSTLAATQVASAISVSVPDIDLEKDDITEPVRNLQKILNQLGYTIASSGPGSPGNETNIFGSLTEKALIQFQKDNGIWPSIGYYGPITRKTISEL